MQVMCGMKITELRQKSKGALTQMLQEKRVRIDELKILSHQKKVKNVKEAKQIRKDIARILTLLHV